jgi:hypothetical protein
MLFQSGTTILKIRRDYEAEALLLWRDLCPRAEPLAVNFSIIKGNHTLKIQMMACFSPPLGLAELPATPAS